MFDKKVGKNQHPFLKNQAFSSNNKFSHQKLIFNDQTVQQNYKQQNNVEYKLFILTAVMFINETAFGVIQVKLHVNTCKFLDSFYHSRNFWLDLYQFQHAI